MNAEQTTFYWHDYETWGLSPSIDKPSQFAGIRTDLDFNIIAEPDMFYCRLQDDYLPNPESALITGITPEITQSQGIPEFEFAQRIHQQYIKANTCVVGYNNIRFDEEFSRNLFYRNFYDPYEYTWNNGNSRWDIIDLVRATHALRPEGINWPNNDEGKPSFRLELLTKANGISHEQAHDAMSDVYATIAMAKLIKQKSPKIFNYYFDLRNKNKVKALIDISNMTPLIHISGMFGTARGNTSIVAPICWHPINTNAVVVVDLSQDISPLSELSADEIRQRLYTKHDDLDGKLPIPLKLIHVNKCPFIAIYKTLLAENAERLGINREQCLSNLEKLKTDKVIPKTIQKVFLQENSFDHEGNVDAMIYDGFFSSEDKKAFVKIRKTKAEKLAELKLSITDKRFKDLFFNYRARNFPQTLADAEQDLWTIHRQSIIEPQATEYFSNINSLIKQYQQDEKKLKIINSLQTYAQSIVASIN